MNIKNYILTILFTTALSSLAVQTTNTASITVDTRNYTLAVRSDNGATTPSDGDHFYSWRSTVPCSAVVETNGWLFTGWSGDATTDQTGTNITVLLDVVYKAVVANYSDDPDSDGLKNTNEWAHGSNPWLADTDDDGFGDKLEVDNGGSPTISDAWRIDHIRANGGDFDLYGSNVVLDVNVGQALFRVEGGTARLDLQLKQSDDLENWTDAGDPVEWTLPLDPDKKFFRVRAD